eukprot:6177392-Pleurochrysis_carterae.AAC.4
MSCPSSHHLASAHLSLADEDMQQQVGRACERTHHDCARQQRACERAPRRTRTHAHAPGTRACETTADEDARIKARARHPHMPAVHMRHARQHTRSHDDTCTGTRQPHMTVWLGGGREQSKTADS